MTKRDFKYKKVTCSNLHDVVALIKTFKTQEEGQEFLRLFRQHLDKIADTQLSKFLQRYYSEESAVLHSFLELPIWEKPSEVVRPSKTPKTKRKQKTGI